MKRVRHQDIASLANNALYSIVVLLKCTKACTGMLYVKWSKYLILEWTTAHD